MVLNRPHPRHVQVLPGRAGVPIPSIIGNVDEHIRSVQREPPHLIGKDRLIANKYPERMTIRVEHVARLSPLQVHKLLRKLVREEENSFTLSIAPQP